MQLTLHSDYGLRVLIFLARAERQVHVEAISDAFGISKDHLVKVVQSLVRLGVVETRAGRGGGVKLARDPSEIDVGEVLSDLEGRRRVLPCVDDPTACVLEPGCRLRVRLMQAEQAFYDSLAGLSVADLVHRPHPSHGLSRLAT